MFVYSTLKKEIEDRNFKRKLDNCLYVLPHMLKRRRHDQSFLDVGYGPGLKFKILLELLIEQNQAERGRRPSNGQAKRAAAILDLLQYEATETTLQMVEDGD